MKMRITTCSSTGSSSNLCEACNCGCERTKTQAIYVNAIPYELYVALLNSYVFSEIVCKDVWGEEKCDLTGEPFEPTFLLYLCNKCYKRHIEPLYVFDIGHLSVL